MKNKKFATVMLTAVMACMVAVSGCSKTDSGGDDGGNNGVVNGGKNQTGNYQNEGYAYVPAISLQKIETDVYDGGEMMVNRMACFVRGTKTYMVVNTWQNGSGQNSVVIKDTQTGEQTATSIDSGEYTKYFNAVNGFAAYDSSKGLLSLYDDNWELTGTVGIGSAMNESVTGNATACRSVVVDNGGNTALIFDRKVLYFDKEYNLTRSISLPDNVSEAFELIASGDGRWYVVCNMRGDTSSLVHEGIYELDMQGGAFSGALDVPYDVSSNSAVYLSMNTIADSGFYAHGKNNIYRYDENTKQFDKLFCPGDYGINIDQRTAFGVGEDGSFCIVNPGAFTTDMEYEIATASRVPASQVKERTELVLGALGISSSVYQPILNFNKYNQEYYVKIKDYRDGVDDYEVARQNFYNDFINGVGADIFYVYDGDEGIDLANLGDKGLVANLYDFIDGDEELSREDFVPNLLKQMEQTDGKLYALYFEPQITFFAGKASIFGDMESWNYTDLLNIMKKHEGAVPFAGLNRTWTLQEFMWYSMGEFYDKETGECHFDTDEFKAMLQITAMAPEQIDISSVGDTQGENSTAGQLDRDEVLMYMGSDLMWDEKLYFGDSEVKYVGIPASGGDAIVSFFFGLAVNEQSESRDAAWEFVKSFLDEDFQMSGMFPIMNKYVDENIDKALESRKLEDDAEYIKERTAYLLDNCIGMRDYDSAIYAIIDEEAQAYFAGSRSLDDTVMIIQNRVQLYIDEKR